MSNAYSAQHRGGASAYAQYFAGMDKSMQQKVALTTAFFPTRGHVADMGSGSGRGTYDLACLYPGLTLYGVDINPLSVEFSQQTYQRSNLRYQTGDIADAVFPVGSLDGVLDSSVLHHVTSFNDFSLARLETCLRNQVAALRPGGVLIIRDFVVPDGPARVVLELPTQDGKDTGPIPELSTAALFERFAGTFRSSQHRTGGVPFTRVRASRAGRAGFELTLRDATEFILRKDYRADWDAELLEEYTYYSQAQFEQSLRAHGLRLLASVPIHNPWIVEHRYRGKIALTDLEGRALPFPPTNYFVVGEKIDPASPIELHEVEQRELSAPRFFVPRAYRHVRSGKRLELAERPGRTLDILPWLVRGGRVHVLAKKGFPRPLLALHAEISGFITEPIAAIVNDGEPRPSAIARILHERAAIDPAALRGPATIARYFTSPGGLDECVDAALVEVDATRLPETNGDLEPVIDYGDFGVSGTVRELDAAQLLRAAQVGGTFDARIEIGAYRALAAAQQPLDAWIGAAVPLPPRELPLPKARPLPVATQPVFAPDPGPPTYLRFVEGVFAARAADGRELSRAAREYVVPRNVSHRTATVLPVIRMGDGILVALEPRELPAVERFIGSTLLPVCPAFRLPASVDALPGIETFLRERCAELGVVVDTLIPLGGAYAPSAGATPELVTPFAAPISAVTQDLKLVLTAMQPLCDQIDEVLDAHTKIALLRLDHALRA
jgi:SAM-dependent methyltransferase